MAYETHCLLTACLIMATAVVLQCRVQRACLFNTLLLLLGVTSVIHHSRLNRWIINDATRLVDILVVGAIGALGCHRYGGDNLWILVLLYGFTVIVLGSWCNLISTEVICRWHASVHILFCVVLLLLEMGRDESHPRAPFAE